MLINRSLQFAITREDAALEASLIQDMGAKSMLLICSGGDTILSLKKDFPELKITAFDFNPVQINHLKQKAEAKPEEMNRLCSAGNFESLFRQWSRFFHEFIMTEEESRKAFSLSDKFPEEVFSSKYWPVSFDLHFHDSFLLAMFGEAAIQHAPRGSYPRYFQKVFEKGLKQKNFSKNPFLQHIFFGQFLELPDYLKKTPDISDVKLITGTLKECGELNQYDLIQLSNIFDWSNAEEIKTTCVLLQGMKKGAKLLIRQINNESPIGDYLGPAFKVEKEIGDELQKRDRSLFYSRVLVAVKKD